MTRRPRWHYKDLKNERLRYLEYLVRAGKISRDTAKAVIKDSKYKFTPHQAQSIENLYTHCHYGALNEFVEECIIENKETNNEN